MIPVANCKKVSLFDPISITNAGTAANGYVDTLGYDYLVVDVTVSTSDNSSEALTTLKLGHDTTTSYTNAVDIAALTGGTSVVAGSTGFVIPDQVTATDDDVMATLNCDLRGKDRYIFLEVVPPTTQVIAAVGTLYRAKQTPVGTTDQNVKVVAYG